MGGVSCAKVSRKFIDKFCAVGSDTGEPLLCAAVCVVSFVLSMLSYISLGAGAPTMCVRLELYGIESRETPVLAA